jgi:hypothetical protein
VSRTSEEKTDPCVKQNRKGGATQDRRRGHGPRKDRRALKLCARTPRVQSESRRNSSTSCPVVVLLPFDHHVRGNAGVVRWPQSADNPLPGIRAEQCNVSHFNVPQGQN